MLRNIYEANEISSLLIGFAVADIKDDVFTDEEGNKEDVIKITYANEHHVAVDMFIGSDGTCVSEPYAIKDDLTPIKASETKV